MGRRLPARLISDLRRLLEGHHASARSEPLVCCDACLALHFRAMLAEATEAAEALAGEPGFLRKVSKCEMCKRTVNITSLALRR